MQEKNFKHKIKINVRFSDLDAMRHVNNAAYLSYLEEARISYFNDVLNRPKNSLNFGVVIARIEIDYLQPIMLGDELEIITRVSKLGNKSSDVEHLIIIIRGEARIHAASALTKLVSFDYQSQRSILIPENVKEKIIAFEEYLDNK
ncbi:MAG: thioesterase family protein [Ignavibacteriaceae bacterium]